MEDVWIRTGAVEGAGALLLSVVVRGVTTLPEDSSLSPRHLLRSALDGRAARAAAVHTP